MTPMSDTEETLDGRANRLAREAVKAVARLHKVAKMAAKRNWHCSHCLGAWPCLTVSAIADAEEAINEAEEEANREVYHCGFRTYAASINGPAEYCENEVEHEGDLCPVHEEPDDDLAYESWKERDL